MQPTPASANPIGTADTPPARSSTASAAGRRPHGYSLTLILLTLLGFGLRTYQLDSQSLWYDEGVTAEIAQRSLADLTRWTAQDIQPPLYYYAVSIWGRLAGWSEWSLRFPSVFFGALLTPLMAALASALTQRRSAGVIAALLVAAHPLLIYYSQEARMYSMLTLLVVALAYYVLARRGARLPLALYWTGYVLLATAAIYTHYFAFFFLAALGVVFLLDLLLFRHVTRPSATPDAPEQSPARRFWAFCLAHIVLLLLYAPWLAAMLGQLATDTSYWQGEFKLGEAVRHVANRFTSGETMAEHQATDFLTGFGLVTLIAAGALLISGRSRTAPQARRTLLIGLLWLILPVAGILGLAQVVPKFNARYAMIALPGLLLLWSAGLAQLFSAAPRDGRAIGKHRAIWRPVAFLAGATLTVFLLSIFALANYNWFADVAYTKAEWRQVSAYIRSRIAAKADSGQTGGDLVVLVSGHAWPVWNYYAPDLPPLRLPDLEILDVNAVLDFTTTARPLRSALQNMDNIWLVEWQDDIVDPMKIVPLQLQIAGEEREVRNRFWHLNLSHYTGIHADAVLIEPTAISDHSVNFGDEVYLLDYTVAENGDLLLFWQLHPNQQETPEDLRVAAQLFTEQGQSVFRMVDRRPAGFDFPVFRWQPNQITLGQIPAQEWAGPSALPGAYRMRLGIYDIDGDLSGLDVLGTGGQPLGRHAILDLQLPVATTGPTDVNKIAFAQIAEQLWLEVGIDTEQAEPGQAITAELHWFADASPAQDFDLHLRWRVRETDEIYAEQTHSVTPLPGPHWPTGQMFRTLHQWRPPLFLPPDDYWLDIGVSLRDSAYIQVPMRITGSTRRYTPPGYATAVDRVFADKLHLLGVIEPLDFNPRAGGQVALTLVWQAQQPMPNDYTVTVQWLGPDNRPAAQADLSLPGGSSNWLAGQVELQSVIVNVPQESGTYRLVAAVYNPDAPDLPRLLTQTGEDLIELAALQVAD